MQTNAEGRSQKSTELESAMEKYYQRNPNQLKVLKFRYEQGATNADRTIERQKVWDNTGAKSSCQTLRDRELMKRTGIPRKTSTYRLHLTDAGVEECERLERLGMIKNMGQKSPASAMNGIRIVSPPVETDTDDFRGPDEAGTEECHVEGAMKQIGGVTREVDAIKELWKTRQGSPAGHW